MYDVLEKPLMLSHKYYWQYISSCENVYCGRLGFYLWPLCDTVIGFFSVIGLSGA